MDYTHLNTSAARSYLRRAFETAHPYLEPPPLHLIENVALLIVNGWHTAPMKYAPYVRARLGAGKVFLEVVVV